MTNFEDVDSAMLALAAEHGWALQEVIVREGHPEEGPQFIYTSGISQINNAAHPELIIFDAGKLGGLVLNSIGEMIQNGRRLRHGDRIAGILQGTSELLVHGPIDSRRAEMNAANRLFAKPGLMLPALQILWPDENEIFPGDYGHSSAQPLLPIAGRPLPPV